MSFTLSCQRQENKELVRTEFLLGTSIMIKVFEGGSKALLNTVIDKIRTIEKTMTTSSEDYSSSVLMKINEYSQSIDENSTFEYPVTDEIAEVVKESIIVSDLTMGAFDISIEPIVALWGWGSGKEKVPLEKDVKKLLPYVNWKNLGLKDENPPKIVLKGKQGIDLGGIAKGYAADLSAKILVDNGVKSAIIDLGGNVLVIGKKANSEKWNIGIQEPFASQGKVLAILSTEATSVVTSGIYERYFEENNVQYSHLIDPHIGYPVDQGLLSVTIVCHQSMKADGLSTGVFILGLEKGMALVESLDDVEAIFITKDKNIYVSSGLNSSLKIVNSDYKISNLTLK